MCPISYLLEAAVVLSILHNSRIITGATLALPSPLLYPSSRENIEQWKHDLEPYLLSSENRAEVGAVDTAMSHLAAAEEEEEEEESELEGRLVGREAGGDVLVSGGWRDVFKCPGSLEKADRFQLDWTDLADDAVLPSPTNLQMEHISLAAVHLHWDYNSTTDAHTSVQFVVQCSRDGDKFENASDLLNATEYTFDLLCQATMYQFQVLAYSAGMYSKPSQPTYIFVNGVTAPAGPPTNVGALVLSPYSVELTWEPPFPPPLGGVVYNIYWGEDPGNLRKKEVVSRSTHYTLNSLLPAHAYFFYLVADVSSHFSSASPLLNATTPADLPPVTVINSSLSSSWILLCWSPPPDDRCPTTINNFTVLYAETALVPYPEIENCSLYSFVVVSNNSRSANVTNLVPGTEYVFRVFYHSEGVYSSDLSEAEVFRTLDTLVCTLCTAVSSTSVKVTWETSLTRNHALQTVAISEETAEGQLEVGTFLSSATSDTYLITRLHPWTEYVFTITMGNSSSPAHLVSSCPADSCITLEDAPSRPPCNFAVITSTSHTITLEWDAPPPDSQNGVVTQYFLAYACTTPTSWRNCSTTVPRVIPANGQLGEVEVDNLIPYTEYWFQIAAETHAGKGPTASLLYNTTQDIPSHSPRDISVQSINATTAHLVWNPPEPRNWNGVVVGYTVVYGIGTGPPSVVWNRVPLEYDSKGSFPNAEKSIVVSIPEVELTHLIPETEYIVSISAMTEIGEGPYSLPLTFHTHRSDIFTTLDGADLRIRTEPTGNKECFTLSINWNVTLSNLINNLSMVLHNNSTGANYTLVFSDMHSREKWRVRLSPTAMSYHIPSQQVTQSGQLLLNLQVEVLLLNGSHLHLVSPIMNISAPNCAGNGDNSASVWRIALGVALTGSIVAVTTCLTLCFCLLRWYKRRHNTTTSTSVLMDTYQAQERLEETVQLPLTLRVGDGAVIERASVSPMGSPIHCSRFEGSITASSMDDEDDESSLGSLVGDENSPLLGQQQHGEDTSNVSLHHSSTLQSLLARPTQLPFPPLSRSSPEGQSFSSSSTISPPFSSTGSHPATPSQSPSPPPP